MDGGYSVWYRFYDVITKQEVKKSYYCYSKKVMLDFTKELEKKGARVVVKPVKGFEDRLIAFVLLNMKNTKCNLIELAEER